MIYLCQMQQLHTPDFLERSFGYTAPIPDLIWDHVLWDRISRCTKTHVYIYILEFNVSEFVKKIGYVP